MSCFQPLLNAGTLVGLQQKQKKIDKKKHILSPKSVLKTEHISVGKSCSKMLIKFKVNPSEVSNHPNCCLAI